MNVEYAILGRETNSEDYYLVSPVGEDKERAEEVLKRMQETPTENDKLLIGSLVDLIVCEVKKEDCWWNDPFLCN